MEFELFENNNNIFPLNQIIYLSILLELDCVLVCSLVCPDCIKEMGEETALIFEIETNFKML